MTFRMTARDGIAAGGGIGFAADQGHGRERSPARSRSPRRACRRSIFGTTKQNVTWDVAGTDVAPINTPAVKISLSTDGGLTYPTVLAESTPNDGSAEVTFPDVAATKARIKVEAVGNVFFDVSDADFTLATGPDRAGRRHRAGDAGADARRAGARSARSSPGVANDVHGVHDGHRDLDRR